MENNNEYELKRAGVKTGFFMLKNKIHVTIVYAKNRQRTTDNARSNYVTQTPTSNFCKESQRIVKFLQRMSLLKLGGVSMRVGESVLVNIESALVSFVKYSATLNII